MMVNFLYKTIIKKKNFEKIIKDITIKMKDNGGNFR